MNFARVLGTLWATRKDDALEGVTMQVIQPLTAEKKPLGRPIVAADTVGAGPGETVLYVTAYEAAIPWIFRKESKAALAPLDATIVGIVERVDL